MATERGRLLLLLASDKPQSAAALANAAHEDPAEMRLGLVLTDTFDRCREPRSSKSPRVFRRPGRPRWSCSRRIGCTSTRPAPRGSLPS